MRSFLGFLSGLVLTVGTALAQPASQQKPNYSPQTPNAASLGRFGEHSVNLFTGIPTISIPIYDITAGAVQVPISLNYHAAGHRVNDMASWIGLGWALNAGGMITRSVIGRPDELDGILSRPLNNNLSTNAFGADCGPMLYEFQQYVGGVWDVGYDIFSFSLPGGRNGKFILLADGTGSMVTLMPYERMKVTYERVGSGVLQFTLLDEDGISYRFDQREAVDPDANTSNEQTYTSAWYVSEIRGVRPNDIIKFNYTSSNLNGYTDFIDRITVIDRTSGQCNVGPGGSANTQVLQSPYYSTLSLQEIIFPGGKLSFVPSSSVRSDVTPNNFALDRIDLYGVNAGSTYQLLKRFDLQHSYFATSGQLRLDGVAQQDIGGNLIHQHTLAYNTSVSLPNYMSRSRDTWGYYNGASNENTTLVPQQTVQLFNNSGAAGSTTVGGANRNCSEYHMQASILTKITYPTGGYSQFFYEANRYLNTTTLAGGLRIARIETQASASEPIKVRTYKYGVGECGYGDLNVNLNKSNWSTSYTEKVAPDCDRGTKVFSSYFNGTLTSFDGSPVTYSEVTEYEGTSIGGSIQQNTNGRTVYTFQQGGDVYYGIGQNSGKYYVANYHWNRGQMVSKSVYNSGGTILYKQINTWDNRIKTEVLQIGVLLYQNLIYTADWQNFPDNRTKLPSDCDLLRGYDPPRYYPWPKGNIRLRKTEEYRYGPDGNAVVSTIETDYNADFQAAEQRTNASDGTVLVKRLRYPFDFTLPSNPAGKAKGIQLLRNSGQRNAVIEEYLFKKASVNEADPILTDGKLTLYEEPAAVPGYTYPKELHMLQVQNGCCRLSSFVPASFNGDGSVQKSSQYALELTFNEYDSYANLIDYTPRNGLRSRLEWQTFQNNTATSRYSVLKSETTNYNDLANSQKTEFGYDLPLLGVKSVRDPMNNQLNYEYDGFMRLRAIRDYNQNLVKTMDYNYAYGGRNPKSLTAAPPGSGCLTANPYIVTGTYQSGTSNTFSAQSNMETDIQSPVVVQSGAVLTLRAGIRVQLKPGFRAQNGSNVKIQNAPCN